ncbi:MAG: C39 family peptidase [Nitrospirota bacterium]
MFARFWVVTIVVFLFSCASVVDIPEPKDTHIIENIPFFPQDTYQCGPASLAAVLNYWGINVSPEKIAEEIFSKSARGTLNIDMVIYAQNKGLKAVQYKSSIDNIRKNISESYPIIVLVDYGFSFYQANHFMVVVGYNEYGVIVNSGKQRNKFISNKDFEKIWEKTKYWTLLIKK